jgi:hypothetical protein
MRIFERRKYLFQTNFDKPFKAADGSDGRRKDELLI